MDSDADPKGSEPAADPVTEEVPPAPPRVLRSIPVSEVREDLIICEWHVHMEEFPRAAIDCEGMTPQPGDRVVEYADGRKVLARG